MSSSIDTLLDGVCQGLAGYLDAEGCLQDPETGTVTPSDHYAQLALSLALYLRDSHDPRAWQPFDAWMRLPEERLGHLPFNALLLHLFDEVLISRGDVSGRERLEPAFKRCRLARHYPSNNWTLLARLCHILQARHEERSTASAAQEFITLLDRWTTSAGGFVDFPARGDNPAATPFAYHHKALLLTTLAAQASGDAELENRAARLIAWSNLPWDGDSHAGGFGRSSHALFGDACLIAGLMLSGTTMATEGQHMLDGLTRRLFLQRRADGLLSLNPASLDNRQQGYDGYMFLSVYNAWFAALTAWTRDLQARGGTLSLDVDWQNAPAEDPEAGLLQSRSPGSAILLSTRGQPPQAFSESQVEFRYAGGIPFHLLYDDRVACPAPVRVTTTQLMAHPMLAGWTPVFALGDQLYGLTDFHAVKVHRDSWGLRLQLHGVPRQLTKLSGKGLASRMISSLDWRFLGGALGRRQALSRRSYPALRCKLELNWSPDEARLVHDLTIEHQGRETVTYLNPAGHALVNDTMPRHRAAELEINGHKIMPDTPFARAQMHSSIHGAAGHALPCMQLMPGQYHCCLSLSWTSE